MSQSLNQVVLIGRLTADPQVTTVGQNNTSKCKMTLAVNGTYRDEDGNTDVDFINLESWGKLADLMGETLHKGSLIAVVGSLHITSYESKNLVDEDNNPGIVYYTYVTVDTFTYLEKKKEQDEQPAPAPSRQANRSTGNSRSTGAKPTTGASRTSSKSAGRSAADAIGWGGGRRAAGGNR